MRDIPIARPGDVLIYPVIPDISQANFEDLADALRRGMPELAKIMPIAGGLAPVIYRPAPAAPTDEQIEAAAKRAWALDARPEDTPWSRLPSEVRDHWIRMARAVLDV